MSSLKNIVYSKGRYYVELISGLYHVFIPKCKVAVWRGVECESAYTDKELATDRLDYLYKEGIVSEPSYVRSTP